MSEPECKDRHRAGVVRGTTWVEPCLITRAGAKQYLHLVSRDKYDTVVELTWTCRGGVGAKPQPSIYIIPRRKRGIQQGEADTDWLLDVADSCEDDRATIFLGISHQRMLGQQPFGAKKDQPDLRVSVTIVAGGQ